MQFEQSIYIDKSPEDVYLELKDVSNWESWDPETESASLDGEFVVGTMGKIKPKGAPESKIKLTEVTENKSFTVECKLPLSKMHFVHILNQEGQGTEVVLQLIFTGFLGPVFGLLFGKGINKNVPESLKGLKTYLEPES